MLRSNLSEKKFVEISSNVPLKCFIMLIYRMYHANIISNTLKAHLTMVYAAAVMIVITLGM